MNREILVARMTGNELVQDPCATVDFGIWSVEIWGSVIIVSVEILVPHSGDYEDDFPGILSCVVW
jgi:hypothetical protein